jgi:hypothetical protein
MKWCGVSKGDRQQETVAKHRNGRRSNGDGGGWGTDSMIVFCTFFASSIALKRSVIEFSPNAVYAFQKCSLDSS